MVYIMEKIMLNTKNNTQPLWRSCLLLLMVLLAVSCKQEPAAVPDREQVIAARFRLTPEFTGEIEVKSSVAVNESVIKDVWVVQLNEGGTAALQKPEYITAVSSLSEVNVFLKRLPSQVYFIVNSHNDALFDTSAALATFTAAKIEGTDAAAGLGMTLSDGTTAEAALTENGLPMAGKWSGTPTLTGIAQVPLTRAVAKVIFSLNATLPAGDAFKVLGVRMRGVPTTLQYYRDAAALSTGTYPAATGRYLDYPVETFTGNLTSTAQIFTFYLPENRRGISTQTDAKQKNLKNAPSGQGKYCTYVEISGEYTEGSAMAPVVYMIFLGENTTNDYNLLRNRSYSIQTTIKGQDFVDTRVNRELDYTDNGRAFWFFMKEDLPNTYNFADQQNGACPKGYYSLDYKEGEYLKWIIKPALASETSSWEGQRISSTFGYGNVYWGTNMSTGSSHYGNNKYTVYPVRCLRSNPVTGTKYPYKNGNTITFRDENGGLKPEGIHPNWTVTPVHKSSAAEENKVAAKFEFGSSGTGTWAEAVAGCVAPWRLPTQRELMVAKYYNLMNGKNGYNFWSATENGDAQAWFVQFSVYNTGVGPMDKTSTLNYRCVRDL